MPSFPPPFPLSEANYPPPATSAEYAYASSSAPLSSPKSVVSVGINASAQRVGQSRNTNNELIAAVRNTSMPVATRSAAQLGVEAAAENNRGAEKG